MRKARITPVFTTKRRGEFRVYTWRFSPAGGTPIYIQGNGPKGYRVFKAGKAKDYVYKKGIPTLRSAIQFCNNLEAF